MEFLMDRKDIALAEYTHLENIILNYSDKFYRIRNWLIAILTGLTVAYYSMELAIDIYMFLIVSYLFIFLFYFLELTQRVVQKRALKRLEKVENMLKGDLEYDGPKITESLKGAEEFLNLISDIRSESGNALIWVPYFVIALVITLISIAYV